MRKLPVRVIVQATDAEDVHKRGIIRLTNRPGWNFGQGREP
jgi:hypothetical protein